jgi:arabinofuranosyltransferase
MNSFRGRQEPGPGHFRSPWFWLAFIALLCILVVGWKLFWFLTDDAFITFRYASNSILGHGYTWNPPPFRPVEG